MHESERIKSVAKHYGSQQKFATILGTTQSNVANWIQRGSLSSKAIRMIATNCPEISLDWLTTGNGDMIIDTHELVPNVQGDESGKGLMVNITTGLPDSSKIDKSNRRHAMHAYGTGVAFNRARLKAQSLRAKLLTGKDSLDPSRNEKEMRALIHRIHNNKMNAALRKLYIEKVSLEEGYKQLPYEIDLATRLAVVPVEKEAETYIIVEETTMPPTINKGDVIGLAALDWFEKISDKYIYMLELRSGEVLIRRIVPPKDNDDKNIVLLSDNSNDEKRVVPRKDLLNLKRIIYIGKNI
jgi:hypothetical protein